MLATLLTAVIDGLEGALVRVEVDVASGLPICHIVGLPDAALSEARERVRSAIRNSGFEYPARRITVNLAPAGRRKHGAAYDVAIPVGILVASGQIRTAGEPCALLGELSLSGAIQPVAGVLPMAATLARSGVHRVGVPTANLVEASLVGGIEVMPLAGLDDAARVIAGPRGRRAAAERNGGRPNARLSGPEVQRLCGLDNRARGRLTDVAEVRGLSARGVHRLLRVARSVADLAGRAVVDEPAVLAAADLRDPAVDAEPTLAA